MKRPSKTLIVTITLVVFALIYAIFSSVRAAKIREESVPSLPQSSTIHTDRPESDNTPSDYGKVSVTTENVIQVVRELNRPESYYYETTGELFSETSSVKHFRKTWKQGDWQRIDQLSSAGVPTMHIIYGKDSAFFWEPNSRTYYKTKTGDISADDAQMIMTYEDLLSLTPDEIISASFITYKNQGCIYVVAQPMDLGYQTQYWISTENGLLLAGQAKKNGVVFYSVRIDALKIGEQEDVVFRLPDGTLAMNIP